MQEAAKFFCRHSSLCFTVAAALVFLLCIGGLPADFHPGAGQWLPETVQEYNFVPSDDQRWAHLVTVMVVALFSVLLFQMSARRIIFDVQAPLLPRFGPISCVLLTVFGLLLYRLTGFVSVADRAAVAVLLFLMVVIAAPNIRAIALERAALLLIGAYVAVLILPVLLVNPIPLMETDASALAQFEMHLLHLPMRGAAIAAGQNFFKEMPLSYGLLMPSIMSVLESKLHGLSIASQLRFVQACQVLFCLAAVGAYFAYRRRNYLGILAALLLAGPYWAAAGLGIWHPNQTGLRSLGLPLGMLVLVLAGRLPPERASWWLGCTAGIALLINLETAVAVSAGFAVFLVLRTRTLPWRLLFRMAVLVVLVILFYLVFYRLGLRRFPFSLQSLDAFATVSIFSGGGFGSRLFSIGPDNAGAYIVPFSLLMFAHALYVVIDGFRRLGQGVLSVQAALRVSISVTLVLWLAYYFNAPNWWQIWTHFFLYGFLIIDLLDRRLLGIGSSWLKGSVMPRIRRVRMSAMLWILLFFLALLIPHTNRHLFKYMVDFMYPRWTATASDVSVVSGILMPKDKADLLVKKAAKLASLHAATEGSLVYLTFNVAFIPRLSGLFEPGPHRDMFVEIRGELDFDRVISELLKRQPAIILTDEPTGPLTVSGARRQFQERLRTALSGAYRAVGTDDGWEIWRPR